MPADFTTEFPRTPAVAPAGPDGPLVRGHSHTAGFADQLGERQLKFDHAVGASLETLRIRPDFAGQPAFEAALRERVDELRQVQHPSLATIHGVERRDGEGLCLVSKLTSGRRVSELVQKAHGASFAVELLRLVTPALAMLHRTGAGIAHGAIAAERIVVARDGRLVVVDQVFGSAIEALKLSRQQLNDMGLVVPAGADSIRFDGRTDMSQLGFIALSLLLGRPLEPGDFPEKIPALLDEFVRGAGSPVLSAKLRGWLERAMQISPRAFASGREAQEALGDLPDDVDVRLAESVGAPVRPQNVAAPASPPAPARPAASPRIEPAPALNLEHAPVAHSAPILFAPEAEPARRRGNWMTAALAVLAGVEGVAIAALLYTRPATDAPGASPVAEQAAQVSTDPPRPPGMVPVPLATASPSPAPIEPAEPRAEATPPASAAATPAAAIAPPAAGPRFGGVTVSSAIQLQVFKDGRLVGSTAGPIAVNEGPHSLEFVNEELGLRVRQTVNVRSGQMTAVNIGLPNGRISINAVPWAEVFIDGVAAGETPIANLSLPIGTHEIVFRHPQLGERKQTVVVKVDGLVRVTQTLQPGLRF